jgi:hypothetical protein
VEALEGLRALMVQAGNTALPSEAAPSICTVMPVMKAAPGLSRKTMAALISASVARRRSGTCWRSCGIRALTAPP